MLVVFKIIKKKCSNCKINYKLADYRKEDKIFKCCIKCRNSNKKTRIKTKCIHDRQEYRCLDCNGSGICIHNKQKSHCKDCNGSSICIHDKEKYNCKDCNGFGICIHNKNKSYCKLCGDALVITIKNMVKNSKDSDIKYNRFDELNFINKLYVKNLIVHSNNKCYYCFCDLQYIKYDINLATIERINNDLGHNIGNCVIACRKCNFSRVGNNIN